jgi:hypothetical protein
VLEGIKRTFDESEKGSARKRKNRSLLFCKKRVEHAFHQHKERQVGGQSPSKDMELRIKKIQTEIGRFLSGAPQRFKDIVVLYHHAEKMLSEKEVDDEQLEQIESEIEDLLVDSAQKDEKDLILKEVRMEYKLDGEKELERVTRVRLIKYLRDKFQIPHISPYYY